MKLSETHPEFCKLVKNVLLSLTGRLISSEDRQSISEVMDASDEALGAAVEEIKREHVAYQVSLLKEIQKVVTRKSEQIETLEFQLAHERKLHSPQPPKPDSTLEKEMETIFESMCESIEKLRALTAEAFMPPLWEMPTPKKDSVTIKDGLFSGTWKWGDHPNQLFRLSPTLSELDRWTAVDITPRLAGVCVELQCEVGPPPWELLVPTGLVPEKPEEEVPAFKKAVKKDAIEDRQGLGWWWGSTLSEPVRCSNGHWFISIDAQHPQYDEICTALCELVGPPPWESPHATN